MKVTPTAIPDVLLIEPKVDWPVLVRAADRAVPQ